MRKAIQALYEFARCDREYDLLQQVPGYNRSLEKMERAQKSLRETLTPEQRELLKQYICAIEEADEAVSQVLFSCGVSVGLELALCTLP